MPAVSAAISSTTAPSSTAATTSTSATTRTSAAPATISSPIPSAVAAVRTVAAAMWSTFTIEVRLIGGFIWKIAAALNHQRATRCGFALGHRRDTTLDSSAALRGHLRALLLQNRLAREPDAVAFHRQHFHQHLVAFLQFVADIGNPMFRHFADMQQTFRARNDLDKRSEICQPRDFPEISLPYLGRRGDVADNLQRLLGRRLIARRHLHQTGVFHIDLDSRLLDDRPDHLSTRPNQIANLVRRDLDRK